MEQKIFVKFRFIYFENSPCPLPCLPVWWRQSIVAANVPTYHQVVTLTAYDSSPLFNIADTGR